MRKLVVGTALLVLAATVAAGCGGDDDSDGGATAEAETNGEATAPEVSTLSVGVLPIIDVAPLFVGIDQGFFEEEGLTVEPEMGVGGSASVPAIVGGELEIAFSGYTSLLVAEGEGLDLTVVSDGVAAPEDPEQAVSAILAPDDSEIETPADLEGSRVAVGRVKGVGELSTRVSMDEAGADASQLEFVEVPAPERTTALEAGEVDAGQISEPFLTPALDEGANQLLPVFSAVSPGLGYAGYFSAGEFAAENPATVEAFRAAMTRSLEYSSQNPDAVRESIPSYTDVSAELGGEVRLPVWPDNTDQSLREAIEVWTDAMTEYEFLDPSSVEPGALLPGE